MPPHPSSFVADHLQLLALQRAISAHPDLFLAQVSAEGKIVEAFGALETLSGHEREQILGVPVGSLFDSPGLAEMLAGSSECAHANDFMISRTGQRVPVSLSISPMKGAGFVLLGRDLTAIKTLEDEASAAMDQVMALRSELDEQNRDLGNVIVALEGMALFDGLTGVANHRHFREQLRAMLDVCARVHQPMALIAVDVDHFKEYNDMFGHGAGDEVLAKIGAILKAAERVRDLAARPGGEEFALLLPITDLASATEIAESVRQTIEQTAWHGRPVTASFGVACSSDRLQKPDQLQAAADEALYEAKAQGRNRVCTQGPAAG